MQSCKDQASPVYAPAPPVQPCAFDAHRWMPASEIFLKGGGLWTRRNPAHSRSPRCRTLYPVGPGTHTDPCKRQGGKHKLSSNFTSHHCLGPTTQASIRKHRIRNLFLFLTALFPPATVRTRNLSGLGFRVCTRTRVWALAWRVQELYDKPYLALPT